MAETRDGWTKGPWTVGRGHFSRTPVIYGANHLAICTLYSNGSPVNMERVRSGQRDADSKLIAAAPDMAEALEALAANAKWQNAPSELLAKARAALAKARGQEGGR